MKTIADFKRKMIVGSIWQVTHEYIGDNPSLPKDLGTRECGHVQSNSFAFKTMRDGKEVLSWGDWPKKTEFKPIDDNNAIVEKEGFVRLTYKLIQQQAGI